MNTLENEFQLVTYFLSQDLKHCAIFSPFQLPE